jgi:hypothetical protein
MSWVEEDEFIQRKGKTKMSGLAFDEIRRDRWGREIPHPAALAQDRRRLARDDVEDPMSTEETEEWLRILNNLPAEERDELRAEFSARARDNADPDQFRSASTGSLEGVGVPDPRAQDRRRARDRRRVAADGAPKSPISFETIFPGSAKDGGGAGSAVSFEQVFPGSDRLRR